MWGLVVGWCEWSPMSPPSCNPHPPTPTKLQIWPRHTSRGVSAVRNSLILSKQTCWGYITETMVLKPPNMTSCCGVADQNNVCYPWRGNHIQHMAAPIYTMKVGTSIRGEHRLWGASLSGCTDLQCTLTSIYHKDHRAMLQCPKTCTSRKTWGVLWGAIRWWYSTGRLEYNV